MKQEMWKAGDDYDSCGLTAKSLVDFAKTSFYYSIHAQARMNLAQDRFENYLQHMALCVLLYEAIFSAVDDAVS
jgi:hypothetical protein